jgi:hypothetical protein
MPTMIRHGAYSIVEGQHKHNTHNHDTTHTHCFHPGIYPTVTMTYYHCTGAKQKGVPEPLRFL